MGFFGLLDSSLKDEETVKVQTLNECFVFQCEMSKNLKFLLMELCFQWGVSVLNEEHVDDDVIEALEWLCEFGWLDEEDEVN